MLKIVEAHGREYVGVIQSLFQDYAERLGVDLCFQNFEQELAGLPGDYAPPDGCLLMAQWRGTPCGCIAMRRIEGKICEMKRLYVKPEFRGKKIGKLLCEKLFDIAREKGYATMRLDTLPQMTEAIAMYRAFGAREIPPYRFNPVEGALFMEIELEKKTLKN